MTEHPNIKHQLLEYALEQTDGEFDPVNLYTFAESHDYEIERITAKVTEIGYPFEWGVSPRVPWLHDREDAQRIVDAYENDEELPEVSY